MISNARFLTRFFASIGAGLLGLSASHASPLETPSFLNLPYVANAHPGKTSGSIQTLDLYTPRGSGPFPLVVWIHGGGWNGGDKESGVDFARTFVPAGFALASLNYRLTGDAPFPAQIEDCRAALAWLRANAAKYHLDPTQIGLMGHSAGAHLAALLATGDTAPEAHVQAVVCWAGPYDLDRERGQWPPDSILWDSKSPTVHQFFNGDYSTAAARAASPESYIHEGLPPFLVAHGDADTTVPLQQAVVFASDLTREGVDVTLRVEKGKDHGGVVDGDDALQFFQHVLQGKPAS